MRGEGLPGRAVVADAGDQQRKDELGRDHFEGRSGRGFHHHAMTILAYGFLLLERHRAEQDRQGRVKKGAPNWC